jgi:hypothetical protein
MAFAVFPSQAPALIGATATIDGPSQEIVGFGGVAMAPDGSGGLVYLRRVGGVPHVFVARYAKGRWRPPVQVDQEDTFAASEPRIGAASSGGLVVVWATPSVTVNQKVVYKLASATLAPGSEAFGPPVTVDRNVGEGGGVSPDLSMSSTGAADVVYRVVKQSQGTAATAPPLRPGDVQEEVRVARFAGERWTDLGAINRDPALSMRPPTGANAPQIAIGGSGNGVVVWQEPDAEGVARIWARRLFGSSIDYPMQVSASSYRGVPIAYAADAPSVAFSRLGQAVVAYRQLSGPGSPLPGARAMVSVLPDGESEAGASFLQAEPADPSHPAIEGATVGRPTLDLDEQRTARLLYDAAGTPRLLLDRNRTQLSAQSLAPAFVGTQAAAASELTPVAMVAPAGGGLEAWPSADAHGEPAVAITQEYASGAAQVALASGAAGGPITGLAAGRSGSGSSLIAFEQGSAGTTSIVAVSVSAPPGPFTFSVPGGWIAPAHARVEWTQATSANGPLRYTVVLDGRPIAVEAGVSELQLPRNLPDGVHRVRMAVTDALGQSTVTAPELLRIGPAPPQVSITSAGGARTVLVRVQGSSSPVLAGTVRVSFGDGARAGGSATVRHRYRRAGRYTVVVRAANRAGAQASVRRTVTLR